MQRDEMLFLPGAEFGVSCRAVGLWRGRPPPAAPRPCCAHPIDGDTTQPATFLRSPTPDLEIGQAAELASGTIHPILARLEQCGWLESRWEDADPTREGRPRRRYYRLTPDGVQYAATALARVHTPAPLLHRLNPGLAGGAM